MVNVRTLEDRDLPRVAEIHLASFPRAAISRLGLEAARRFYESLLIGPHDAYAVVAVDHDCIVGYCFGGVWHAAEAYFLRRNILYLAFALLRRPWLLAHPFFRSRITPSIRLVLRRAPTSNPLAPPAAATNRSFGIQSIAVDPAFQGRGVGRVLLQASEAIARGRGFTVMDLSVHTDNAAAVALYKRTGWEEHLTDGVWHGFMYKCLS